MTQYGMLEKHNKLKIIALLSSFALPGAVFLSVAWCISLYTSLFDSLGQYLLILILTIPLIGLSGYLTYVYIGDKYLKYLNLISSALHSILTKTYKPLPPGFKTDQFREIFAQLDNLNNELNHEIADITGLKENIAAQNNLFETAFSEVIDPVITLNLKFEVKSINPAAQLFTGINRINVIGKRIDQFVRFYDKNNQEILSGKYANVQNNNPEPKIFFGSEIKIISGINKEATADVSVFQPLLGKTIDISVIIVFHDKSREKQLESMKLDFVSMAAHELRTPLTSIKGYISVFLNENQTKLTPDQLMFIRRINTSTQQLAGLVENLLSVARVERGAMSLNTQIVDWITNVKTQVDTFRHRAEEKRIKLIMYEPKGKIPSVEVDLVRMNEVLNNIISNAINYTEPQGKIEVWVDTKDEQVCTHVRDTGKGMPREALSQLFSKFFRIPGGTAEQASKGNGLGLYLSKAIVDLHNGKIWAESEGIGKGSTFSFCLPSVVETFDINLLTKKM